MTGDVLSVRIGLSTGIIAASHHATQHRHAPNPHRDDPMTFILTSADQPDRGGP